MTLAGTLEAQEPILEHMTLNFDLKRRANLKSSKRAGKSTVPLYQLSGTVESIVMNVGQRDLATILMTYQDNIAEGIFAGNTLKSIFTITTNSFHSLFRNAPQVCSFVTG
jgi:vacuolar protein sorting-associated protein 13A/C